ncbi:hypothetical protein HHI36_017894 [Cryptolaemus montrouzieri]|uniref:small monomeric GTPase n=1 Tax=Cryptolaemus montrouzieri TaxID=559131 RepID=A0ABD2NPH9_9CUCU
MNASEIFYNILRPINTLLSWSLLINNSNSTCSVSINTDFHFVDSVFRYDFDGWNRIERHFRVEPDLFVINLDGITVEFLEKLLRSSGYYPDAKYIFYGSNNSETIISEINSKITFRMSVLEYNSTGYFYKDEIRKYHFLNPDNFMLIQMNITTKLTATVCSFGLFIPYITCYQCSGNKGLNIDFLEMLFDLMKVEIEYKIISYHAFLYNEEVRDIFANGICDLLIGGHGALDGTYEFFFPINDDYDVWVVPGPMSIPKWKYIGKAFSTKIWLSCLLALILQAIVWCIYDISISNKKKLLKNMYLTPSYVLQKISVISKIFLGGTMKLKIRTISEGIILILVIFSTFMINVIYKIEFTYLLLGTNYYPNTIKTFDDIITSRLNVTCSGHIFSNLIESFPEGESYLRASFVEAEGIDWAQAVAINRTFVALRAKLSIKYSQHKYLDDTGHSLFKMLNPPVFRSLFGYLCPKGSPLLEEMRKYMFLLKDYGFANRITMQHEFDRKKQNRKMNVTSPKSSLAKLGFYPRQKSLKVMVLGQGGVGKTAMVVRFITRRYIGEYDPSLEKVYTFHTVIDNEMVYFDILDTAGQPHENECLALEANIRWAEAFILMYSVTDKCSFDECYRLKFLINYNKKRRRLGSVVKDGMGDVPVVLVGNKMDQIEDRMISSEEGQRRSKEIGCVCFHEISVRESIDQVWSVFRDVCRFWRVHSKNPSRLRRSGSDKDPLSPETLPHLPAVSPNSILPNFCRSGILGRRWTEGELEEGDESAAENADNTVPSPSESVPFRERACTDGHLHLGKCKPWKWRYPPSNSNSSSSSSGELYTSRNDRRMSISMRGNNASY